MVQIILFSMVIIYTQYFARTLVIKRKRLGFPATKMPTSWNMHATKVDTLLNRVGKEVDYYVSMHDFRRTFATICNLLRFNIYVTKRLLNHTAKPRIDVTGGYVQIPDEELRSFNEHD